MKESALQSEPVIRALSALAQEHRLAAYRLPVQSGEQGLAAVGGHVRNLANLLDAELAQASRDQLGHLAAEVDDEEAVVGLLCHTA